MLTDSHAHLALYESWEERDQIVRNAQAANVTTILTIGTTLADSRLNVEIAHRYPQIFATVGVHPHDAKDVDIETVLRELSMLAADPKVVAIGEIGLDFYRNISPPEKQRECFRAQLELARQLRLPVIIHDREAHQEILDMIEKYDLGSIGGIVHCFSGDLSMARRVIELGLFVSIAGPVTFKNAGHLTDIAAQIPLESLLIETDCPFLAPSLFRGKRNEPAYVRYVAEKIAHIRGISVEDVAEHTSKNFARLFRKMG